MAVHLKLELGCTALVALLICGCVGSIGGDSGLGDGNEDGHVEDGSTALIPTRTRLLSRTEYDNTVEALLLDASRPAESFPPDEPQNGYSNNVAKVSGPLLTSLYVDAAETLARTARQNLDALLPCDRADEESCARAFISSFGKKAFRRPLTEEDEAGLYAVYLAARTGGSFDDGLESVIGSILMAPSFLYITELGTTELGGGAAAHTVPLDPYETASAISYLVTASMPDESLMSTADIDGFTPSMIEAHVRRLVQTPAGRAQMSRFFVEWLAVDAGSNKDANTFPGFAGLRGSITAETSRFVEHVLFEDDGTLTTILTAPYAIVDQPLADFYGFDVEVPDNGAIAVSLEGSGRAGLLTQANFLSNRAGPQLSSPIKRGVWVLRRMLCTELPDPPPGENNVPPPDPTLTTRETFERHVEDPACASCHSLIDPIGFGFEHFDAVGAFRTMDNGKPVDSSGTLTATTDVSGSFDGAAELTLLLAGSDDVHRCFARNVLSFASAQNDDGLAERFARTPSTETDNVVDLFVAFATSDLFAIRKVSP